ncbi:hypothetical protein DFH27DRAFT_23729 [Peziza echinospora]|nr:hypothetical protein DFH27DRAFT_23729 [Peziza echinospora]
MKLQTYSAVTLSPFARLHNLKLNGISIASLGPQLGLGIVFDPAKYDSADPALLTIDRDLILSAESVELAAKSDERIRDLLKACCGIQDTSVKEDPDDITFDLSELQVGEEGDEEERRNIRPWGRNPRLMIMLFLAVMMARGVEGDTDKINDQRRRALGVGTGGIWSEYIKFLPSVSIPTTWSAEECALLKGTSLDSAITAKLGKLEYEYHSFKHLTSRISWCRENLWEPTSPELEFTFTNWTQIDAWFRSRVLELPRIGVCLIPYLDMVNHSNEGMNAHYQLNDITGNVELLPIGREHGHESPLLDAKERTEVRINYGAHKSSAELLFSYGFIDSPTNPATPKSCTWLSLPLPLPSSDPLTPAKEAILTSPPTLKLIDLEKPDEDPDHDEVAWLSDAIWLIIANAEDGLRFHVLRTVEGGRELKLYWKEPTTHEDADDDDDQDEGTLISAISELKHHLENSPLWEVFLLRAIVTLSQLLEEKLEALEDSEKMVDMIEHASRLSSSEGEGGEVHHQQEVREDVVSVCRDLREREGGLIRKAARWFERERERLMETEVVKEYLQKMAEEAERENGQEGGADGDYGEEEDLS